MKVNNWMAWKQEQNYQKLFWSSTVSGIGNRFTQVATLTLIYQITESGFLIGILFAIRMLPFLFLAPIGGILANRFPKRKVLILIDVCRIPFAIAPIFVHGPEDLWILFTSAFMLATGEALYAPARMASIPETVKQDNLLYINAIEQIMVGGVLILGSSAGGIISYLFGLHLPFILDGISFLWSAYILTKMTVQQPSTETMLVKNNEGPQPKKSTWIYIFGSSAMMIFIIIELTMPIANGIDNVLISVYALDVFDMGDIGVGLMYGMMGGGFVLSSFLSNMLQRKLILLMVIFIALEGLGHIFLSTASTFSYALFIVLSITFVGGLSNICLSTIIMTTVPKAMHGTFFGVTAMISNTSLGISMGLAGLLLEVFEPRTLSFYVGIIYILLTIFYTVLFRKVDLRDEKLRLAK